MKAGWALGSLGDLCQIRPPKSEARERINGDDLVSFAGMEELGIDRKFFSPTEVRSLASVAGSYTYFADGDVLLAKITPCFENGKLGIASGLHNSVGFGSSEFVVFRPGLRLNAEFLYYYLLRPDFRAEGEARMGGAVGQQRIPKDFLEKYRIPMPSLPEQRRIVDILDRAFAAIATAKTNTERNTRSAHDLFVAALHNVFTTRRPDWKENAIGELAEHSLGKMLDKAKNKGTPQPYLRNLNVRWFGFDLSDLLEMRFLPAESLKYQVSKGDVVVCEGGYPGRAAIWEEDGPVFFQKALHRVRFHEPAHSKWFVYFLYFMNESGFLSQYFSGTGIQHFTGEALDRFRLPIPTVCELRTHVARLERLQQGLAQISRVHERKLEALGRLKASVLQQAFSGAL